MTIKKDTKIKVYIAIALVVFFGLLMLFMFSGENFDLLKSIFREDMSNEELQNKLRDFGVRGHITVTLLAMLQVICTFLPAEPVQVLSGLTFGFPIGLLCCWTGVFLGNTLIYVLQNTYGDKLRRFFIKKLHIDLEKIAKSNKSTVIIFILYFLPAIPYGMICFFAASIGIRYRRFLVITMLGALPSVCIGVALGYMTISSNWIVSLCVFVVLIVLVVFMWFKRDKLFSRLNDFADKPQYTSKTKVQKCNGFLLTVLYGTLRLYYFLRGIRIKTVNKLGKQPEAPAIVLCNHGSFIDFVYAATLLRKSRPHFVAARLYFYHKWLGSILKKLGSFPKSMFARDIESTKNCIRVLQDGEILAMMPEARLSTVGRFEDIQETTYSFLKKSQVPVYTIKLHGDYFADPKWGKGVRRGALVEAELELLFTPEQICSMSLEEIKGGVEERLYYDEFQWLKTRPKVRYRSKKLAEGLENILTVCPVCGKRHTIQTKKRDIFCENCGKLTSMDDRYGFAPDFRFENFAQWYDWQKELLKEQILGNEDFSLTADVELRLPGTGNSLTREAGKGVCTLNREGLRYVGTKDRETFEISFSIERVYRLLFGAGENFEIYNGTEILYFVPSEKRSAVDWYLTSMILYDETVAAR